MTNLSTSCDNVLWCVGRNANKLDERGDGSDSSGRMDIDVVPEIADLSDMSSVP